MDQNLMMKQRELTRRLNIYRNEYYNKNSPSISDEVYDRLFVDLCQYFGQKKLKYYADFFSSSSSLCCGVI